MNFADALALLEQMTNPTLDDLRALVQQTNLDLPPQVTATLLYSGRIGELTAHDVAKAINAADGTVAIIDHTDVARLLSNDLFADRLTQAVGDAAQANALLYGNNGGFWSNASERFAQAASGNIVAIVPEADPERIFAQVEVRALLANPDVTSINGIAKSAFLDRYNSLLTATGNADGALLDVFDKISDTSYASTSQFIRAGGDGAGGVAVKVDERFFRDSGITGIGAIDTSAGHVVVPASELLGSASYEARSARLAQTGDWLKGLRATGEVLGPVGDLLQLTSAAIAIKSLLDVGDRDGAAREAASFLGNFAGGYLSASAAASLLSPMLLGGPIGWVGYGILVAGAGFVGSVGGERVANWLFEGIGGQFFGQDNSGLFVDVYQRGADGQLYVTRVRQSLQDGEIVFGAPAEPQIDEIIVTAYPDGTVRSAYIQRHFPGAGEARFILDAALLDELESSFRQFLDGGGKLLGGGGGSGGGSGGSPSGYQSVGTGPAPLPALRVTQNPDGSISLNGKPVRAIAEDPRNPNAVIISVPSEIDSFGSEISIDLYFDGSAVAPTGVRRIRNGDVEVRIEPGQPTTIRHIDSPIGIDFVNASEVLASTFGRYLFGGNLLSETISSAALTTLASNLGDLLNAQLLSDNLSAARAMDLAFEGMGQEFLTNLQDSGVGAISAFITAQLLGELGLDGLEGEAASSLTNYTITTIAQNLADIAGGAEKGLFDGLQNLEHLGNVAGSFLGNKLAAEIANWDELGEQLGSSVGGSLGGLAGPVIFQGLLPVPVLGALVGSLIGNLLGGLIGGVFTGTPKSGAILEYDEADDRFEVRTVWKEDGGKKRVANELAMAAANTLNQIIAYVGGELVDPESIDAGSYGMRGKRYVYWNDGYASDDRVKFKRADDLIEYGVLNALEDFKFLGGDIYAKRAFYNTLGTAGLISTSAETGGSPELTPGQLYDSNPLTSVDFGVDTLLGNFAVVERLRVYLRAPQAINGLIAAEPDSAFAADWMLALSRINDLGLLRRHASDWSGGFGYLLQKAQVDARDVQFQFQLFGGGRNGERAIYLGAPLIEDTIDSGSKTVVEGTAESERIAAPAAHANLVATVLHGYAGDDEILAGDTGDEAFGGYGDDRLVGGALDDWLFGGAGNDVLDAGGGDGNLLAGDEGDDRLHGCSGSDWLVGGSGVDRLIAGGGDDVLEGGTGDDFVDGGAGSDTIIYRPGHGVDAIRDTGTDLADLDRLEFGTGIGPGDLTVVARSSGETLSLFVSGGGRLDLRGVTLGDRSGIDEVSFTNATWSRGDLLAQAIFAKTTGSPLTGTAGDEEIVGTIYDDRLNGGGGTDRLEGGFGSDTYLYNLGDGVQTIVENGHVSDLDTLQFGAGIAAANLTVSYLPAQRRDLIVSIAGGGQVILKDQLAPDGANSIEQIVFADGTSWTLRDLFARIPAPPSTAGADVAIGSYRGDVIATGNGNDSLTGMLGNDSLDGGNGSDTYHYALGDGDDRIIDSRYRDSGSSNKLVLGAGITTTNVILARDHNDWNNIRIGFAGASGSILLDDQLYASSYGFDLYDHGMDIVQFADGTQWNRTDLVAQSILQATSARADYIQGSRYSDAVVAGDGDDIVVTSDGADTITGGLGNDNLDGGNGVDTYYYNLGDGHDRIVDSTYRDSSNNVLIFGASISAADLLLERDLAEISNVRIRFANAAGSILLDDQLYTSSYGYDYYDHGIGTFRFADGTVWSRATLISQILAQASTADADYVIGTRFADVITGLAGHDVITSGEGADIITGGAGNDNIDGGNGSDTYHYGLGDGDDRIVDSRYRDSSAVNTLVLGPGIAASDLILRQDKAEGTNLRITFAGAAGSILLDDQFYTSSYGYDYYDHGIDQILFADGTQWNRAAIVAQFQAQAITNKSDYVPGTRFSDTIASGAGNDIVTTGEGNDSLTGGTGDDSLDGGKGADTYYYNVGDGHDRIYDDHYRDWSVNRLVLGAGIAAADLIYERDHNDANNLRVTFANVVGSILLDDQYVQTSYAYDKWKHGVDQIELADGTVITRAEMENLAVSATTAINGTTGMDVLTGTSGRDNLFGNSGNDTLTGGAGADLLRGGAGNDLYIFNLGDGFDLISDESGTDTVRFGAGIAVADILLTRPNADGDTTGVVFTVSGTNDRLFVKNAPSIERYEFADGTVWTEAELRAQLYAQLKSAGASIIDGSSLADTIEAGSNGSRIYAGGGNDILKGGAGQDLLQGGSGDDTYLFGRGAGRDLIVEEGGTDTVMFGSDIAPGDLLLSRPSADGDTSGLVIAIAGTEDRLYIKGATGLERFQFADGTVWTEAQMRAQLMLQSGTAGADIIHGTNLVETIVGGAGSDRIYGLGGNDILQGGLGNDLLEGGAGDDIYRFDVGDGSDVIYDESGADKIVFGAGIDANALVVTRPRADGDTTGFILSLGGTDQIYVKNATALERYEFANGTVLTEAQMRARYFAQARSEGDDVVQGSGYDDTISGGGGDDRLYGAGGHDILDGGRGDDLLQGGAGNDSYIYNFGDGRDVIADESGSDVVKFGAGISESDIIVTRPLADGDTTGLILSIRGTNDSLYVKNASSIEQYQFSDGVTWTYAIALAQVQNSSIGGSALPVTMGDDVIIGSAQADIIQGMGGDDVLRGGMGSDTYKFNLGDGYDTIFDPVSDADTDILILGGVSSAMVRVITSPTDTNDVVLFIDDANQIYLDEQKVGSSSGIEQIQFADGVVWTRQDLIARAGAVASAGDDHMIGTNFADTFNGGPGNDTLSGRAGGDTYVYGVGDGNDVIFEESAASTMDAASSLGTFDKISFGSGIALQDIRVSHGAGDDVLLTFVSVSGSILLKGQNRGGGAGVEFVSFADGTSLSMSQLLMQSIAAAGTSGADEITGFLTSDDLVGGLGDDLLAGGRGSDRFHVGLGDGNDTIVEVGSGAAADQDELVLGADIDPASVALRREAANPNDLLLILAASGQTVRIKNQFSGRIGDGLELVRFADGTVWSREQLLERYLTQPATPDSDFLLGSSGNDHLSGLGGDDLIEGGAGDDILAGDDGADVIRGGPGADQLFGGADDDLLSGDFGQDSFDGGSGFDTLDYSFSLDSWTIDIAAGTAVVTTGGAPTLTETFTNIEAVIGGAGADVLMGDAADNRLEGREGNDTLHGGGGNDVFVYRGSESDLDIVDGGLGVDRIEALEDGTIIGLAGLANVEQISGNGHAGVVLTGTDLADTFDLSMIDVSGISLFYTAAGDDLLIGTSGIAAIDLGLGNDVYRLSGNLGPASIVGGDGSDRIEAAANDTVIGLAAIAGIEAITANGFSNVTIRGTVAADTLNFSVTTLTGIVRIDGGDGNDIVTGSAQGDTIRGGAGNDVLAGGAGNDTFEIVSDLDGIDTIDGGAGTDTILVKSQGVAIRLAAPTVGIEAITGMSSALIYGSLADSINLSAVTLSGIVSIDGGAGNDTIIASAAADTILAGLGNDTLTGNGGNDLYKFNLGDGQDIIVEYANTGGGSGGTDALVFGAGILADEVRISRSGNDVVLTILASGESVTLRNQASTTSSYWVEEVRFDDGTVWDRATTIASTLYGTAGDDQIVGSASAEIIHGFAGNDRIEALGGDDRLYGGDGNDVLLGGAGTDMLDGGAGIDTADSSDLAAALTADLAAASNQVRYSDRIIEQWMSIENVIGGASRDYVDGTSAANSLSGGLGDDWLYGHGGSDVLAGDGGNDFLAGGAGSDTITGGDGNDSLYGDRSNLLVNGSFEHLGAGGDTYATWGVGTADMPGWTRANSQSFEAAGSGVEGIIASDGNYWLDMISGSGTAGRMIISQEVTGLANSQSLTLEFDVARRAAAAGANLEILWNGSLIGSLTSFTTVMTTQQLTVTAQAGVNTLTFRTTAGPNGAGVSLDNVRLFDIASDGDDLLSGGAGDDRLYGGGGADTLDGGAGADILAGGSGIDVARYSGAQADYQLSTSGGILSIIDLNASNGDEGTDQLSGIETLQFNDGQISISSPVVLDLDGDGVELIDRMESSAWFDWNGDGVGDDTGWIGGDDGFLTYDRNGDGRLSGVAELSFVDDKEGAKSDLDGLSAFDSNGDGRLSSADAGWSAFHIWRDADGDGKASPGEYLDMAAAGVASINLAGTATERAWAWGSNIVFNTGTFTRVDGSMGGFNDVALSYAASAVESAPAQLASQQLVEAVAVFAPATGGNLSRWRDLVDERGWLVAGSHDGYRRWNSHYV